MTCPEVFVAADLKYQTKVEIENTLDAGAANGETMGRLNIGYLVQIGRHTGFGKAILQTPAARKDWDYTPATIARPEKATMGL